MPKRTSDDRAELKPVKVGAAAIDIGSKMHMAAVDPSCADSRFAHSAHSRKICMIWQTGSNRVA